MSFGNFRFQGPMPLFQFRKMRFYGHIGLLSQSRWAGRPSSSARTAVCYSCIQSRVCLATAKLYGANFREVLLFQHRFTSEVGAGACRRPTFVSVGRPFQTGGLIYGFMVRYGSRQAHEHDAAGLNLLVDLDYLAASTPSTGPQGGRH